MNSLPVRAGVFDVLKRSLELLAELIDLVMIANKLALRGFGIELDMAKYFAETQFLYFALVDWVTDSDRHDDVTRVLTWCKLFFVVSDV